MYTILLHIYIYASFSVYSAFGWLNKATETNEYVFLYANVELYVYM